MGWMGDALSWTKDQLFGKEMSDEEKRLEDAGQIRDISNQRISDVMGRQAPQAEGATVGQVQQAGLNSPFRNQQLSLTSRLSDIAGGRQAGAGELASRRMAERSAAQQMAMANSNRGGNAALAARGAARNIGDINQQAAGQAQQAAMQDQQMARQTLSQVLGQGRQADTQIGLANMDAANQRIFQQAQLDQATSLANAQARLQMMGMNDQAVLGYLSQLYGVSMAELQARLGTKQDPKLWDLMIAGGKMAATKGQMK